MNAESRLQKSGRFWIPLLIGLVAFSMHYSIAQTEGRTVQKFDNGWRFTLGDVADGQLPGFDDSHWRQLNLPHDWSIEGTFSTDNPATVGGGALPGGIGWYRKEFTVPDAQKDRLLFVEFDGVYRNSQVWLNGHFLGARPYGYSSFEYELTPYLRYGNAKNVMAVRVDNSEQPNSRWYSGSGIYRNVWLTSTAPLRVDHWGTYVTTPTVTTSSATVAIRTSVRNSSNSDQAFVLRTVVLDPTGKEVASTEAQQKIADAAVSTVEQFLVVAMPSLWSIEDPSMYRAVSTVLLNGKTVDRYETPFGVRTFEFTPDKGFFLNGKPVRIKGVCDHHDLGCLGSAVNYRAIERQVQLLKGMGVNAIRTSHNPPAPELLEVCDRLGVLVMDEAFDMWKLAKTKYDYANNWDEWHGRDISDMVLRDRNHPSVIIWSIGNEVREQWDHKDTLGIHIARELAGIVRSLDPTRVITAACNDPDTMNTLFRSGALDLIGQNYSIGTYPEFPQRFPGKKFIATETTSALETRGHYDMPSDSIRRWPIQWDKPWHEGNPDHSCSAYDNCSAPWGSTHEETWKIIKKYDFLSGMFIWTGSDYLGEPTPYDWPSRSSYFGIIDLAGFPKDSYYMYQSEWTTKPMLHLFPHWNWKPGQTIDAWVYTNCDEVELFLNGKSMGTKHKVGDELHLMWRLTYEPGTLKAVARTAGKEVLVREVRTAGPAAAIVLEADRSRLTADGDDLSFVTAKVVDGKGTLVPDADNLIRFAIAGPGTIDGVDNGLETSLEPMKASEHKAFNGLCLAVVRSKDAPGEITLTAKADGLKDGTIRIQTKR